MGLRRLDDADWLEVDDDRAVDLQRKSGLLDRERAAVLQGDVGGRSAAELCGVVLSWLGQHAPGLVEVRDDVVVETTTCSTMPRSMPPLELAARCVQEDLCVLERDADAWRLVAACVCFPSRWSLASKLGATLAEIHGPVPGFDDALGAQTSRFFDRLVVDRPVWRCNWTLLDTDERFLPSPAARGSVREPRGVDGLFFRVERQTLRRLERSGAVAFTIRTYVTSLRDLLDARLRTARELAATLATVPDDVAAYKGWTAILPSLRATLAAIGPE